MVMYEMMCGRLPFYSRDHEVLFELILVVGGVGVVSGEGVLYVMCAGGDQVPSKAIGSGQVSSRKTAGERSRQEVSEGVNV